MDTVISDYGNKPIFEALEPRLLLSAALQQAEIAFETIPSVAPSDGDTAAAPGDYAGLLIDVSVDSPIIPIIPGSDLPFTTQVQNTGTERWRPDAPDPGWYVQIHNPSWATQWSHLSFAVHHSVSSGALDSYTAVLDADKLPDTAGDHSFYVSSLYPDYDQELFLAMDNTPQLVEFTVQYPTITIGDVSLTEGDSGTKSFDFPVTLSDPTSRTVTVNYTTANDTATAGVDFTPTSGTLTFDPDEVSKTISVEVIGETLYEQNETFSVVLSNPGGTTILDGEGVGTIENDDVPKMYYVNDAATTNDEWCTVVGDDANDGLSPAAPKATVQAILSTYTLGPGDVVRIDTGTYNLTSNIEITAADCGESWAPVTFEASPYGVTMDRGESGYGKYVFRVNSNADYITLRTATSVKYPSTPQSWMEVTGGKYGIYAYYGDYLLVDRLDVHSNVNYGIYAYQSHHARYTNNLVRNISLTCNKCST